MFACSIRKTLAAIAVSLAAAAPAAAQDALAFNPCDENGASALEARLDYAMILNAPDLAEAWQTLFCGRTPLKRAVQRVGFSFTESFSGFQFVSLNDDRNVMDRAAFLENYGYLDAAARDPGMVELLTSIEYSPGRGVVVIGFEGEAGTGTREFRQYRGKWIWIGERHVIVDHDQDEEGGPGC